MFKTVLWSLEFCHVTHLQKLKKFRWPVNIVKLRNRQKITNLKTIANFNKILLKFVILVSFEPFQILQRLFTISFSKID